MLTQDPPHPYALTLRRLSTLPTKPLEWLWHHRIPRGKITLLVGDPGSGKTALTLDLAARLSTARPMPDASQTQAQGLQSLGPPPSPPMNNEQSPLNNPSATLLLSPDDNAQDTLRPTLERLHANLDLIHLLPDFHSLIPPKPHRLDDPDAPTPLQQLDAACSAIPHLALLVIDPITYYLGLTDRNLPTPKAQGSDPWAPRSILRALAHLAEKHNIAIVLTTRLAKAASPTSLHRTLGSLATTSTARSVLLLTPTPQSPPSTTARSNVPRQPPESPDQPTASPTILNSPLPHSEFPHPTHLLLTLKSNLTAPPPPLPFTLTDRITWSPTPLTAKALAALHAPATLHPNPQCDAAADFLLSLLANGPRPASEITKAAKSNSIAPATLSRAKASLGILSIKQTGPYGWWYWKLPDDPRNPPEPPPADAPLSEILIFLQNRDNLPENSPFYTKPPVDNLPPKPSQSPRLVTDPPIPPSPRRTAPQPPGQLHIAPGLPGMPPNGKDKQSKQDGHRLKELPPPLW